MLGMLRLRMLLERRLKRSKITTPLIYTYDEDHERFRVMTQDRCVCTTIRQASDIPAFIGALKRGCHHA